jgi:uncharacterized protein involved in exopolysaccharide biosynthesis
MTAPLPQDDVRPGHLPFADWLSGVLLRWRIIAWSLALTFVVAGAAILLIKPRYEAEASFLVNGAGAGKGALGGGGLAGLAGQLGLGVGTESSESPAFYKELLESRELLTRLLESRFPDPRSASSRDSAKLIDLINIRPTEPRERMDRAVKKIRKRVTPETNVKTALVRIYATTQWPELSAQVGNRVMELVNVFNREQRTSRARAKRLYLHERMDSALAELRGAEWQRRDFLSKNRKMDFSPSLQLYDDQLKYNIGVARDDYQTLQKQFDAARIDEFNDAPLITIVDAAVPPAKPVWPRLPWIIAGCVIVGLIVGVAVSGSLVVADAWGARNPESASRLSQAWSAMRRELTRRGKQRHAPGA